MSCTVYINTDSHMWLNSKSEAEQKIIDFVILQRREMCQDDLITLCNELGYEQMIMRRPWISFDMVNVWFYWHVKEEFNQRLNGVAVDCSWFVKHLWNSTLLPDSENVFAHCHSSLNWSTSSLSDLQLNLLKPPSTLIEH